MALHKVIELIVVLLMLIFLGIIVTGVLIGVTIVQELTSFNLEPKIELLFMGITAIIFLYITKMVVDRIKEYNRYI